MAGRRSAGVPLFLMSPLEPRVLLSAGGDGLDGVGNAPLTAKTAEVLARGVAYDNWTVGAQVIFDQTDLQYEVAEVFDDAVTGFYALGLTSSVYGPALVLRGTEPNTPEDLLTDFNPKGIGYNQFESNWQDLKDWLMTQPAVDMIGHSLGGALAQWVAAAWMKTTPADTPAVDQVFTFCSPGITNSRAIFSNLISYASDFVLARATSVTHYIVLGDLVSMAGERYIDGSVVTASFRTLNPVSKHVLPVLNENIGDRMRPADTTLGALTINQLNSPAYVHDDPDYRMWVLGLQVTLYALHAARFVPAPTTLVPTLLMRRDTCEASRKVIGAMLVLAIPNYQMNFSGASRVVLTLSNNAHPLFHSTSFIFASDLNVNIVGGLPPSLRFNGGMSLAMATSFSLPVPAILGGPFQVNTFVDLGDLDLNGQLDRDRMLISGSMSILGGLAAASGATAFHWADKRITIDASNISFLDGFVTAAGRMIVSEGPNLYMAGSSSVHIPNWSLVPRFMRGQTLANGQFRFNYTHDQTFSNDYISGWGTLGPVTAGLTIYFDGSLPRPIGGIRLPPLFFGPDTNGASFSVAADQQWLVLHAGWENPDPGAAIRLITPEGQILEEPDIIAAPNMQIVPELSGDDGKAVYIQLPAPGTWRIEVVDPTGLGELDFDAFADVPPLGASFVSLTGGQRREPVQIQLGITDPRDTARVDLYYAGDNSGENGTLIAQDLTPVNGALDYSWDVTQVPPGEFFVYAVVSDPDSIPLTVVSSSTVTITEPQPAVVGSGFEFEDFQALHVQFDQDVSASLELTDLTLTNQTTNMVIPAALLSLEYDIYTNTATLTWPGSVMFGVPGILPDGNYRLSAPAGSITNSDLEPLSEDLAVDFFVLAGDADRDGRVNLADFNILASNFGQSNRTFSQGDFNYDGVVNLADFNILAAKFGFALSSGSFSGVDPGRGASPFASTTRITDASGADDPLTEVLA